MVRVAFDIGGVLSKYPDVFRLVVSTLVVSSEVEVYILSDMKPHAKAVAFCHDNDFFVPPENIICCDYEQYGETCKAVECERLGIDILVDDFPGYVATVGNPLVRLLVMPDPSLPYYADSWKTDGSEGNFGRRNPLGSKRPTEDRKE